MLKNQYFSTPPPNQVRMKTKTLTLFGFFSLCFLFCSWGQENTKLDSLINLYKAQKEDSLKVQLAYEITGIELYQNPAEAKKRMLEMVVLSKKLKYDVGEANAYHRLGNYYGITSKADSAEYYFKKSLDIANERQYIVSILNNNEKLGLLYIQKRELDKAFSYLDKNLDLYNSKDTISNLSKDDFKYMGSTFHTMSNGYQQKGMYNLALKSELKALELYQQTGELYVADAHNTLGIIAYNLKNYAEALAYYNQALPVYQKHNDVFFQTLALLNIAKVELLLKHYEKAIELSQKGIALANENNFKESEAKIWQCLGNIYEAQHLFKVALKSYQKSIALYKELNNSVDISYPYGNIGGLLNKMNKPHEAKNFLDKAIVIADSSGNLHAASTAYYQRTKTYKLLSKPLLALNDQQKYLNLKDSIFTIEKNKQIEELRIIHDIDKKEQHIVLQEKEIVVLEQEAKINNQQRWLLGGGMSLSLLALGFGFYGFRQRTKKNKLEKEKVESELAFKKKELTTHALHLAKKNEVLENVKQKAAALKTSESGRGYQQLIQTINFDQQDDKNWENFIQYFEQVHKDFNRTVRERYPEVTKNELRLMALLKMNLSTKEIANILNISIAGVKKARNRLRKKLEITPEESLEELVITI